MKMLGLTLLFWLVSFAPNASAVVVYNFADQDFSALNNPFLPTNSVRLGGFIAVADNAADDGFLSRSEIDHYFVEAFDRLGNRVFFGSSGNVGASLFFLPFLQIDDQRISIERPGVGTRGGSFAMQFRRPSGLLELVGWTPCRYTVRSSAPGFNVVDVEVCGFRPDYEFDNGLIRGTTQLSALIGGSWTLATRASPPTVTPPPAPPPAPPAPPVTAGDPATTALLVAFGFGLMRTGRRNRTRGRTKV